MLDMRCLQQWQNDNNTNHIKEREKCYTDHIYNNCAIVLIEDTYFGMIAFPLFYQHTKSQIITLQSNLALVTY